MQAASFSERVRLRAELSQGAVARLTELVGEWSLLADLGFCDLVLFVRTWNDAGWHGVAHTRAATAPTQLLSDPDGMYLPRGRAPAFERAWTGLRTVAGEPTEAGGQFTGEMAASPMLVAPVRYEGRAIGVLAAYGAGQRPQAGELESEYHRVFLLLVQMVALGRFPAGTHDGIGAASPRVGDGLVVLAQDSSVRFASPNARMALRALGVGDNFVGSVLAEDLRRLSGRHVEVGREAVAVAAGRIPGEVEISTAAASVTLRSIPLVGADGAHGAVLLVRDVTQIRAQERALMSKDASISEIHHRVKNNLQTVGALLRLQARRLPEGEGRSALGAAMARVDTIAMVHDALSRSPGDDADFDDVCSQILAMAGDAAVAHSTVRPKLVVEGRFGELPTDVATPLAMVLNEILHNAVEHASAGRIVIGVNHRPTSYDSGLQVSVHDDGVGFDVETTTGLGLQIVRTLVSEQLDGTLAIDSELDLGTTVVLECPLG